MISRRDFARGAAGAGALAALAQLGRSSSVAQVATPYRAMVTVFLFGGNDAWNMVVPTDGRYAAYVSGRGAELALKADVLTPLTGTAFGLHPAFAPLKPVWDEGGLGVVLNAGTLFQPLTRTLYTQKPELRPLNLMSHADQQAEWQGMRTRDTNLDGFLGRLTDRMESTAKLPPLISLAGSNLALIGARSSPLILPSAGTLVRNGYSPTATGAVAARQTALAALSDASAYGPVTSLSGQGIATAYDQATAANAVISATTSAVDAHFKNPTTGAVLTSDISRQLLRVARMIEARGSLGHSRQTFFVSQGGYDTHSGQVDTGNTATGRQAALYVDLALALAGFYNAMKALGLAKNVTAFTMSDFGRVYKANAQRGTDHAWGSNHLVIGGALKPNTVHGRYPDQVLGGAEDANSDGRWIPSIAIEEYVGAIAQWYGVAGADLSYVFPNWATWNGGGRGPVPLFA